jgi:hypothetical protein
MFGCGRLIRVLCFFCSRGVVGVSCSVVGPKRYERWGVKSLIISRERLSAAAAAAAGHTETQLQAGWS